MVHDRTNRSVYGDFLPVHSQARELCIKVGEVATLKEGIVRKSDTWMMLEELACTLDLIPGTT
jgi:hypothetical protein